MRLKSRKNIGQFFEFLCTTVLIGIGLGEVFGTAHDLMGFMPLFALESDSEKDH